MGCVEFRRWCVALAILLVDIAPASATPRSGRFGHITVAEGLADQRVQALLQDRAGFMWFGTNNGLDRFDGHRIVSFREDPDDPSSLSGNVITDLLEDRTGKFWVATRSGLNLFDPRTERFKRYLHDPADPTSLSDNSVMTLHEDREGTIWVGTFGGLNRFDRATGTFTRFVRDPADPRSLGNDSVLAILDDRSGALWIGTLGGLDLLDRRTRTFSHHRHDPANPDSLSYDVVWGLLEDRRGELWLATDGGGLELFDRASGKFVHHRYDPTNPASLVADRVDCLFEDASGSIWIGTFGGGVSVLDPERGTFSNHKHDPRAPTSLSSGYVAEIVADRSGLIWLATQGSGVDVYNPDAQSFEVLRPLASPDDSANPSVWAIQEGRDGELWLGTEAQGLVRVDRKTGAVVHYDVEPGNPRRLGHPWVSAIAGGRDGPLWVGTMGGGLYRLDRERGVFDAFRHQAGDPTSLSHDNVLDLHFDREGRLWIATRGGGLNRFDPVGGGFTAFRHDPGDPTTLSSDWVGPIAESHDGKLWIGTRGAGLDLLEPSTGRFTHYRHDAASSSSLADDNVFTLHVDRAGTLWVGLLGAGLDRFEPATGTFVHYRQRDGLPSDRVAAIVEDGGEDDPRAGNLWISTARGLARVDRDRKKLSAFDASDGLPLTEFNPGRARMRSGEIMLSSTDGVVIFDPATLGTGTPQPPPVVLTSLQLDNRPVSVGAGSPLKQAINATERIELSYSVRVISLEFAALTYRAPQQSRYRYMLEGFDSHWNEVDATHRLVSYTNLDPGRYRFRVTAADADGVWNTTGRTLAIVVVPPWWATWWFRALTFALVAGCALSVYLARKRSRNRQWAAIQAEIVERRRAEAALRDSEARYRGIVEDQTELICRFLPGGIYTFVNAEYCRYFQSRPEDLLGKSIWRFIPAEEHAASHAHFAAISADRPVATIEHRVVTPTGEIRWQQWTNRGLFDQNGTLLEFQSVGRDITARVRAEEGERQLTAQRVLADALREEARRKDDFLAVLAHELRNPLAPVAMAVEVLRSAASPEKQAWAREVIGRQVKQLARLVDDLLDVSRISRGMIALRKETLDLRAAIGDAIETCRPLVDRRRHQLVVALPEAPVLVHGDRVRLSQVVSNLLNNAAKYSEPGANIHLDVSREAASDVVVIRVRDDGIGIPPEMLARVFEPFRQVDETRDRAEGGLGIGLTLVRKLVELHGGTVEASSAGRGRGSEFRILLPAAPADAAAGAEPHEEPAGAPVATGSLRVLVVDDNVDAADAVTKLLTIWRHLPSVVHDGQAALEAAAQLLPDVVLLDLGLPKLGGLDVARRLREEHGERTPMLVALTGYGQPDDHRRTREAGFDHHLVKPVQAAELRDVLATVKPRAAGQA
jgi:PAS domain S-box-containing protein